MELLYFTSDWCSACENKQTPIINSIEQEYSDRINFQTYDISNNQNLSSKYHIHSLPTIIIRSKENDSEQIHEKFIGITDEETIKNCLDELVNN